MTHLKIKITGNIKANISISELQGTFKTSFFQEMCNKKNRFLLCFLLVYPA